MKLEKIVTLSNKPFRLRFLGLERSLRATGCDLPLLVIPYDDRQFDLPANSTWWTTGIRDWLIKENAHPMMYKCQCLTTGNYQYLDSDAVFLKNPEKALAGHEGFITSCSHWHNPDQTITAESLAILMHQSTCWQRNVFNAGQFACDRPLYTEEELKRTCLDPRHVQTCLRKPYRDQPAMVLLANLSGVPITNLTFPPTRMESTWAGDYYEESYENFWTDEARKPYLMHWAGSDMWNFRSVDPFFTQFLTAAELAEWKEQVAEIKERELRARSAPRWRFRTLVNAVKAFTNVLRG